MVGTKETRVQYACQDANNDERTCCKHRSCHRKYLRNQLRKHKPKPSQPQCQKNSPNHCAFEVSIIFEGRSAGVSVIQHRLLRIVGPADTISIIISVGTLLYASLILPHIWLTLGLVISSMKTNWGEQTWPPIDPAKYAEFKLPAYAFTYLNWRTHRLGWRE